MDNFDAALKRAFAEAPEPEDAGFTVHVAKRVAWSERIAQLHVAAQGMGLAAAGAAVAYGVVQMAQNAGPELLASLGLELVRAQGALAQASAGALMMGVLVVCGGLGAGAFAIRSARG
ncbi:MAG TPA: hypothetical protein VG742_19940 [Dongiaceae bacterium]|nr:hypothetical protein [Dongiaceae bacterium]